MSQLLQQQSPTAGRVITTIQQREMVRDLRRLAVELGERQAEVLQQRAARDDKVTSRFTADQQETTSAFQEQLSRLRDEYAEAREAIIFQYESDGFELFQQEEQFFTNQRRRHRQAQEDARERWQTTRRQILEEFKEQEPKPRKEFLKFKRKCDSHRQELAGFAQQAQAILRRRGCALDPLPPPSDSDATPHFTKDQAYERFTHANVVVGQKLDEMHNQRAARFVEDGWPVLLGMFAFAAFAYPCYALLHAPMGLWWLAVTLGLAIVTGVAARQVMRPFGRRQTSRAFPGFQDAWNTAQRELSATFTAARLESERRYKSLVQTRDEDLSQFESEFKTKQATITRTSQAEIDALKEKNRAGRIELAEIQNRGLETVDADYPPQIERQEREFAAAVRRLSDARDEELEQSRKRFFAENHEIMERWRQESQRFHSANQRLNEYRRQWFPAYDDADWEHWNRPEGTPIAAPFGNFTLKIDPPMEAASDVANDATSRSMVRPTKTYTLPAYLSFPECPSLLLKAENEGRAPAIATLQNVMLRLLTAMPPGKVRFTIFDPVGLGQAFSAFMHLADFDDKLVTNRIWTEPSHMNQRLLDLTEHMENVIQKYLRNEFASIQEYNQHAGEVAEPFHVLVVANFPAGFSDEAAGRLLSIAASGARCGVSTLISVDTKMKMPRNFDLADLETHAQTLLWRQTRFHSTCEQMQDLPLELEPPPGDKAFTEIVRAVGRRAKDAGRVEVPFEKITPPIEQWWTGDSRSAIETPIGRAGATKLQTLRLGKGTSQHVLIAGKTGSGKSTLLHVLITSLAVQYSPDEVQFYLIDFKKGVEFKSYAALNMPHAQVIAIESEREFGMSVLQRLDAELRRRGDWFREQGVQDIRGFRDKNPDQPVPRILLIIDEFQEFFVSDDKISQDSSLLLDRLVRQGRAFGIHVLLGSQTLSGAYSLARSTLGQMAVRIALQCSESDAHLILSEENTAARLLDRPGEAIYNDANGLLEGNHPFQIVWLPDHQREHFLRQIADLAIQRNIASPPPIVFEGNAAANPAENQRLKEQLSGAGQPPVSPHAWMGAPVSIKDPTAAVLRRQSGGNLLIVGPQEESALGILCNGLISVAAQVPPIAGDLAQFYVLDGARPESASAGFWRRFAKRLPLEIRVAEGKEIAVPLSEIAGEVDRRVQSGNESLPPIFLVIHNLSRFRELKKSDDFAFSSFSDDEGSNGHDTNPATTNLDKKFVEILKEGPPVGVHTLIWCDTYNNVNRWIDRQTMRDLALRVLFQMSAADSSNLMDSPLASRLGVHRAILYSDEEGQFEKFRPYSAPTNEWLEQVGKSLQTRIEMPSPT